VKEEEKEEEEQEERRGRIILIKTRTIEGRGEKAGQRN